MGLGCGMDVFDSWQEFLKASLKMAVSLEVL